MADPSGQSLGSSMNAPPPPPPPQLAGALPAKRLASEIPDRRNEPPLCVQNAMMTKDKKPFTYTPGGIDLSQIRSPRMARRIVRNAKSEGVTGTPAPAVSSPLAEQPLSPSVIAAMQPQTPVQVFPNPPPPPVHMRPSRLQPAENHANKVNITPVTTNRKGGDLSPVVIASPSSPGHGNQIGPEMPKLNSPPIPWMHQNSRRAQEAPPPWTNRAPCPPNVQQRDDTATQPRESQQVAESNTGHTGQQSPGVRIIPIQVEGAPLRTAPKADQNVGRNQQVGPGWGNGTSGTGSGAGPVQSRSFRILQQTTEGYDEDRPKSRVQPTSEQLRRMQLTEDDKNLMDQFKAQVNEESSLHTVEEPRFRGAAIPSKAFRVLQTMTGSEMGDNPNVHKGSLSDPNRHHRQARAPPNKAEVNSLQQYIPPSEQKVSEPKKYTGCSIPGRSFKMLQAITAPENYGPGQSDL